MLGAVTRTAPGFENLRDYIVGANVPTDVKGFDQSRVRQPLGLPNGAVPGVNTLIPTSSARPWKPTNARIVYSRVCTHAERPFNAANAAGILEGDIVFVNRRDGSTTPGYDFARTSRLATITQLNDRLARVDKGLGDASDVGVTVMAPGNDPRGETLPVNYTGDELAYRWQHCRVLSEWALDGIVATKEHDAGAYKSNAGDAYNVAVSGPTLMRNAAAGESPQHVDDGVRALDKIFVGLFFHEHRDDAGTLIHYAYEFKQFTSRQRLLFKALTTAPIASAYAANNALGPTNDEFSRMVSVWRVGSVLDTRSGMLPYNCANVNVVVEEWSLVEMNAEFG